MKVTRYKCENCGLVKSHINSYNDKYCYECIDITTGKLKKEIVVDTEQKTDDMDEIDNRAEDNGNLPPGVDQRDLDDMGFRREI